ncbi:TPA: hypothetical protein PPN70_000830 [Serratia rubidaea]|nr:hypothetical protein [Serratia rubidaea]MDK1703896.1 hypothetical protein [Serratia rubidaea]HDJ1438424.1 hypothetical protein [Serratia rubidaea]HDJ1447606.1 hypothetical protein [Serratia rubidaea]HDJ1462312.1 hypothetical protein [Serratia rubidaea]HDJ2774089.1 hypothetical protein [Serratia rubidaea]
MRFLMHANPLRRKTIFIATEREQEKPDGQQVITNTFLVAYLNAVSAN